MTKEEYIRVSKKNYSSHSKTIIINQINNYYDSIKNYIPKKNEYNIGDEVLLKKGTLLHGTYKNIEGLIEIANNGLLSSSF